VVDAGRGSLYISAYFDWESAVSCGPERESISGMDTEHAMLSGMDTEHVVLIVDDDKGVLHVLKTQLSHLPYCLIATSSSVEAIHVLRTKEIAVLICDLGMPDIDGVEVLHEAREANPGIVSIVITGGVAQEDTIRAINEGGVWKFLLKPWEKDELLSLVKEAVERYVASQIRQTARREPEVKVNKAPARFVRPVINGLKAKKQQPMRVFRLPAMISRKKKHLKRRLVLGGKEELANSRYKFGEIIGEGGIGRVYKAEDMLLGMPVAIKVLSKEFARDSLAVAKLKEEARIAMQLSHSHIVRLHNLQEVGGNYFLVMEHVEGRNFRRILEKHGRMELDFVVQVAQACGEALSYAHRRGILHLDLKPENIMLTSDGVVKIIDFGTACLVKTQNTDGEIFGTPDYMSPEHLTGMELDARSDIYSLAVIIYELLTGAVPAGGEYPIDAKGLAYLPPNVVAVLAKAMAEDQNERWETAADFAAALTSAACQKTPSGPDPVVLK
jgi:CheY-like chemotaxis protein/tRNA A-37 threonylcarbamoyl transferase component Bud32